MTRAISRGRIGGHIKYWLHGFALLALSGGHHPSRGELHTKTGGRGRLRGWLHAVHVLRSRKSAATHVLGIVTYLCLDRSAEISISTHELRRSQRQPQHVLEYKHLPVACGAGADADGRNWYRLGYLARQRLGYRFDDDGEGSRFRNGTGILLDG